MDMTLDRLVYDNYDKLNDSDKYIWDYILNNKQKCEKISIQELANNCNVSHTTVLRFAQKLGLNGYSELKFYLKWENKISNDNKIIDVNNAIDDITKTMDILKERDWTDIFEILDNCNKIYAYGSGEVQKNAVKDLKRNLLIIGKLVHEIEGKEEAINILNYIKENDVVFLYSLSGENKRFNDFANKLKEKGVKIISVSQMGNNTLSKISDINIQFYTRILTNMGGELYIYSGSQYFIISEIMMLKYIEYMQKKQ